MQKLNTLKCNELHSVEGGAAVKLLHQVLVITDGQMETSEKTRKGKK